MGTRRATSIRGRVCVEGPSVKTFDCVCMKRQGTERVMKQLEGKSLEEQLEYWQKATEDLKRFQEKLKKTDGRP